MERVLVAFPTHWDERHLAGDRRVGAGNVEVVFAAPSDADCPDDLDVLAFVDDQVAAARAAASTAFQGIFSSSDYPGATVAAAIATELGLAGPHPSTVMRSAHKYYSRLVQREAAPEATPDFALVDPKRPDGGPPAIDYPCFVKPVKGSFSVLASRIDSPQELAAFLAQPAIGAFTEHYMRIFNRMVARYGRFQLDGSWFLAEGLLRGAMVTVEGFATPDGVEVLGVVDSVVHPRTGSFLRFDYPSRLPAAVQRRMEDVARRVVERLGLMQTMFNIEMTYDAEHDRVSIIEVNPRICGQFADLYEKVHGVHGYQLALELALGRRPQVPHGAGPCEVAASVPLRVLEPVRVTHAPGPDELAALEAEFPGTLVWSECVTGQELSDFKSIEDGSSARYAVINTGAANWAALDRRIEAIRERAGFAFEPLGGTT